MLPYRIWKYLLIPTPIFALPDEVSYNWDNCEGFQDDIKGKHPWPLTNWGYFWYSQARCRWAWIWRRRSAQAVPAICQAFIWQLCVSHQAKRRCCMLYSAMFSNAYCGVDFHTLTIVFFFLSNHRWSRWFLEDWKTWLPSTCWQNIFSASFKKERCSLAGIWPG